MSQTFAFVTRFLLCLLGSFLVACGGGGVSGSAPVTDPSRITILPATATLYSGVPTTFVISGGTGSYIVSSSNQNVVPVAGAMNGNTLIVTPNAVGSDTAVTLTVRDTGTTPVATSALTVRPGTVSNDITVNPSSTQGLNCAPAVCSGGDALVTTTLSQAGVPLGGHTVRFDAISGDFFFVTSATGSPIETLATSVTVPTDQAGRASARIRVTAGAANQTALLQVTDVTTGSFQRTSFVISQATGTSPGFFATPSSITFQGRRQGECAGTDISAVFYVFGGSPPYFIANTISTLIVRPDVVISSGMGFTVTPTGSCIGAPGVPITIRDSAGRTTSVSVANIPGTEAIPALAASPQIVNLSSCDATANVQVAGGRSGTYFVASGSDSLLASISGSTVTIRRRNPSGPSAATGSIGISDGTSVVNVAVTISGPALGACPSALFTATPATVTLTDCSTSAQVVLSGGSGTYSAAPDNGAVTATVNGNLLTIKRTSPSGSFTGGIVTVSDGQSNFAITVNASGAGAGACGGSGSFAASPTTVTLTDCSTAAFVTVSNAAGPVSAASSSPSVSASVSGSLVTIRRVTPSAAFGGGTVIISDGASNLTITVNASGAGAGACGGSGSLAANPSSVTLTDCSSASFSTISNAAGPLSAVSSSPSVSATVSGSLLTIRRINPSAAFAGGSVVVSDGTSNVTVTVNSSGAGAAACTSPTSAIVANPSSVTLTDCVGVVQTTLSGGTGNYSAASSSGSITASVSGSVLSVRRTNPSGAFSGGTVTISDGTSTTNVTVNATGTATGICPTPAPGSPVAVNPTSVTLTDCNAAVQVTASGGSGSYSAASTTSGITATVSGSIVTIRRANPSVATPSGTVIVTDGSTSANVAVTNSGLGAGACPTPNPSTTVSVSPSSVTLTDCTSSVQVAASGGTGSYSAASTSTGITATVSGNIVTIRRANPSTATGGGTVIVSDGSTSATVTVTNMGAATGACPTPAPTITVSPSTITLTDCSGAVQATVSGGSGSYSAASNSSAVSATIAGSVLTVRRVNPSGAFAGGATITVSDGSSSTPVTVNATGIGTGSCPTPSGAPLAVSPTTVTLNDCSGSAQVNVSGGTGTYSASSNNGSIVVSVSGSIVSIKRAAPSSATAGGIVTISDGSSSLNVTVTTSGAGAGACSAPIIATPNAVQLTSCTDSVKVTLSGGAPAGGSGSYIVNSNTFSVLVTTLPAPNEFLVSRRIPSSQFDPTAAFISVTDTTGSPNTNIPVNATAAGAGPC